MSSAEGNSTPPHSSSTSEEGGQQALTAASLEDWMSVCLINEEALAYGSLAVIWRSGGRSVNVAVEGERLTANSSQDGRAPRGRERT